jgi:hypothetical protein
VERKTEFLPVAIHSRVGNDSSSTEQDNGIEDEVEDEGYFRPRVVAGKSLPDIPHFNCRQWSIIAKTSSPTESRESYTVKLYLIPHGWSDSLDNPQDDLLAFGLEPDDAPQDCGVPFYLTADIILPPGSRVLDMGFYGDDGNSTLSASLDKNSGRERRQALGLLLGSKNSAESSEDSIELWLVPYDHLSFQVIATKKDSKQIFLDDNEIDSECQVHAKARASLDEEAEEAEDGVVFAKSKFLSC